jgi:hypothetical protein
MWYILRRTENVDIQNIQYMTIVPERTIRGTQEKLPEYEGFSETVARINELLTHYPLEGLRRGVWRGSRTNPPRIIPP